MVLSRAGRGEGEGREHTLTVCQDTHTHPMLPLHHPHPPISHPSAIPAGWVHPEVTCLTLQEKATSLLQAVEN